MYSSTRIAGTKPVGKLYQLAYTIHAQLLLTGLLLTPGSIHSQSFLGQHIAPLTFKEIISYIANKLEFLS